MSSLDRIRWKRTLRTPSSERLLGVLDGRDAVAVDLHFLADGSVAGTVTVVDGCGIDRATVPGLLERIDDDFLPGVDLDDDPDVGAGGVTFTVVWATAAESFESARRV
ncbi:MAG: hypothetical protein RIR10_2205 [Planctomycetota bacterium]|jgi:hypothetical protein